MPTTFYFSNKASPLTGLAFFSGWSGTAGGNRFQLDLELGGSPLIVGDSTTVGTTADNKVIDRQFVSPPLKGNQTISGPFSGQLQVLESATNDNIDRLICHLRVVNRSGTSARGTGFGTMFFGTTNEFSTSMQTRNIASGKQNMTSINALDGDRIVIEIGYSNSTAGVSPSAQALWGTQGPQLTGVGESQVAQGAGFFTLNTPTLTFYRNSTTVNVN